MKVLVAGAGIGGLALAQGLTRAGVDVEVVERDHDVSESRGYKLHLGPPAVAALRQLLTPTGVERLLGSAIATSGFTLVVRDHRARRLFLAREKQDALSLDVDRSTLRALLSRDLDGAVHWGTTAVSYSSSSSGVRLRLRGGGSTQGDVLVIADGASSRLAHQLAGAPTSTPTGLLGIAGRAAWRDVPPLPAPC
ncbi:FAD-dependent monooxygenase [Cellulomonas fimi]|uniref:FAD-dependent oxidoreductase n=1 Tax=Cellulomonas fimi TaxID=1708 RepID=UPI00234DD928|nr:FAD-dependent monooxygenase [Cellulomonas fimi]MDC7123411.1 FAD-dependent monooxygenase [Cellulomonas fimi]